MELPHDVLSNVLSHLPIRDLTASQAVSTHFKRIAIDPDVMASSLSRQHGADAAVYAFSAQIKDLAVYDRLMMHHKPSIAGIHAAHEMAGRAPNLDLIQRWADNYGLLSLEAFMGAIDKNDVATLKHLLVRLKPQGPGANRLLCAAAIGGNLNIFKLFASRLRFTEDGIRNALWIAAEHNNVEAVKFLMKIRGNPRDKINRIRVPLEIAATRGYLDILEIVCAYPLSPQHFDAAYSLAAQHDEVAAMMYIDNIASQKRVQINAGRALTIAASAGKTSAMEYILQGHELRQDVINRVFETTIASGQIQAREVMLAFRNPAVNMEGREDGFVAAARAGHIASIDRIMELYRADIAADSDSDDDMFSDDSSIDGESLSSLYYQPAHRHGVPQTVANDVFVTAMLYHQREVISHLLNLGIAPNQAGVDWAFLDVIRNCDLNTMRRLWDDGVAGLKPKKEHVLPRALDRLHGSKVEVYDFVLQHIRPAQNHVDEWTLEAAMNEWYPLLAYLAAKEPEMFTASFQDAAMVLSDDAELAERLEQFRLQLPTGAQMMDEGQ
jgi:hypothetical protein